MVKVSVLISAYNVEDYVEESVRSILTQSHHELEVFLADDGSSDATYKKIQKIRDPRVIAYTQNNKGKAATLNEMIARASGEYILIHDSDDISTSNRVEVLLNEFQAIPELAMCMSGHALLIDDQEVAPKAKYISPEECKHLIDKLHMPAHDPTVMARTEVAREIGFEETLRMGQGLDFVFAVAERYPMCVVGDVLYQYRIHPNSITKRNAYEKAERLLCVMNRARVRRGQSPWDLDYFYSNNKKYLDDKDNNLSGHLAESAYQSVQQGRRSEALNTARFATRFMFRDKRYWKAIIYALLPGAVCRSIRNRFGAGAASST